VNLDLPFDQLPPSELDDYLARIDRELDALFLDDVQVTVEQLRAEAPAAAEHAA
jgi:hypothetical protein